MVIQNAAKLLTNSETPLLDARVLLSYVIKSDAAMLFRPLTPQEEEQYESLIRRRADGESVAYIVGEKEFMGKTFRINKSCLIPRPDTETVVEYLIEKFRREKVRILDLCCGSGNIGLSLCMFIEGAYVTLADISQGALDAAEENIRLHHLEERTDLKRIDALSDPLGDGYDIIVSNPPYISSALVDSLEVSETEPRLALDGGSDGLDFYRAITPKAYASLNKGGTLAYEIGFDQGERVKRILEENGFKNVLIKKDYGGNDRLAAGEKDDYAN